MTRASAVKPVRRVVQTLHDGELVAEIYAECVIVRPIRTKRGGKAEVTMTWGQLYQHLLIARADAAVREKRRLARERRKGRSRK